MKKLGFGLMRLPLTDPADSGSVDIELLKKMVDIFMERGFTYFDTAWMYCGGKSEDAARQALVERYPRDSFTLTTKLPDYLLKTEADREKVFTEQLRRTGAGYFDYYWLHNVNVTSLPTFERLRCFDFIRDKKEKGLVKHIGFSYHDSPELLDRILTDHPETEYVQIQLNYLDWNSPGVRSRENYEVISRHGKKALVMEPVKGGTLAELPESIENTLKAYDSEASIPSWAIRFAASREDVMMVLSGMSSLEQILDNTGYMQDFVPLTEEEDKLLLDAADVLRRSIAIPCTGCAYCTVKCPVGMKIPEFFSFYNAEMMEKEKKGWTSQRDYYDRVSGQYGKASACLKCGSCEKICPQHINIRDWLEKVADTFEK